MTETKHAPVIRYIRKTDPSLRLKAAHMSKGEASYLINYFFKIQGCRMGAKQLGKRLEEEGETTDIAAFFYTNLRRLENETVKIFDIFSDQHATTRWTRMQGMGGKTATGLYVYIDPTKVRHVSQVWKYAGLNAGKKWYSCEEAKEIVGDCKRILGNNELTPEHIDWICARVQRPRPAFERVSLLCGKGEMTWEGVRGAIVIRPWHRKLRILVIYIGNVIRHNWQYSTGFYSNLYKERKTYEHERNERLVYKSTAEMIFAKEIHKKGTSPYEWYSKGMLPPVHIQARAMKWATKLFLSHYFDVAYYEIYGRLPEPPHILAYCEKMLGKKISVPDWPF